MGIAFTRAMCSDTLSVGVTQDGRRSLFLTASTAAHELGHLLNMGHDGKFPRFSAPHTHVHAWISDAAEYDVNFCKGSMESKYRSFFYYNNQKSMAQ